MNHTPVSYDSGSMIELADIRKLYGDFSLHVDLSIRPGELVSILGPSGSGKTTTLRLIAGFERPDSGRVLIGGKDVTEMDPSRRRIGFVFQDYTLFPHMNVFRNIAYGLERGRLPRGEINERVENLLSTVGLSGYGDRKPDILSGGERQRVAIARALAPDPLLFLLDEPFSSIDAPLRKGLREELARLRKALSVTTVFVTHSRQEALSISDRVAVLRAGRVVQFDTPAGLYTRPKDTFVAAFVGEANFFNGTIIGREGPLLRLRMHGAKKITVLIYEGSSGLPAEPGAQVTFMVRPDRLRFSPSTGSGATSHENGRRDAENRFAATISDCRYFGHYVEYRCGTEWGTVTVYGEEGRTAGEVCTLAFASKDGTRVKEAEVADGKQEAL